MDKDAEQFQKSKCGNFGGIHRDAALQGWNAACLYKNIEIGILQNRISELTASLQARENLQQAKQALSGESDER